ncbi:hypothetical protein D3C86_2200750 [compost metagenome]
MVPPSTGPSAAGASVASGAALAAGASVAAGALVGELAVLLVLHPVNKTPTNDRTSKPDHHFLFFAILLTPP